MSLNLVKIRNQLGQPTSLQLDQEIFPPDNGDATKVNSIIELFDTAFELSEITVTGAVMDDANTEAELVIEGHISVLNVENATVTILLNQDDEAGKPAFRMVIEMPDGWKLTDSFPLLAVEMPESPLNKMVFTNASLTLSSADSEDDGIVKGLNLDSDIALTGPFETAASLTSAAATSLHLSGWIKFVTYPDVEGQRYPLFDFDAELTTEATLGLLNLTSLGVGIRNELLESDTGQVHMNFFALLYGNIEFGTVTVDASAQIPSEPDRPLEFTFSFGEANLPDFGDVAYLLGGDDLTTSLPDGLEDTGGFSVTNLILKFLPEEKRLTFASLAMENSTSWVLLKDNDGNGILTIEKIQTEWLVIDPSRPRTRQLFGYIFGSIAVGEAQLQASAELPDGDIAAWLVEGDEPEDEVEGDESEGGLEVFTLLEQLSPKLSAPDAVKDFAITTLDLKANPQNETFYFNGEIEDVWTVQTGLGEFGIKSLLLNLDLVEAEHNIQFGGVFQLAGSDFVVLVKHSNTTWDFSAELDSDSKIDISQLVKKVFDYDLGVTFGVENIRITELGLQFGTGEQSSYSFHGKGKWDLTLPGLNQDFSIETTLEISREGEDKQGRVSGSLGTAIEGFEYLQMTLAYEFNTITNTSNSEIPNSEPKGNQTLSAELILGKFTLEASLEKSAQETVLSFDTSKSSLTFGDILTFMAGLVDPSIEEFSLEPPWNELDSIKVPGIELKINLNDKSVEAKFKDPIEILDVVTVQNLGLTYKPRDTQKPKGFQVSFDLSYPGQEGPSPKPVSWDPLNDSAPDTGVPSKAPFELDYLGLGQHIALRNASGFTNVEGIVDDLRNAVLDDGSGQLLIFNRDSDWLIGAKFSLVELLDMSIIFNDPVLYGMVIELGGKAKPFNGLKFEILYRRISDTIGVYHTELTLPDDFRHFNVGAVAVTLPVVVVDIYTNGDFSVDLGFPWNGDWSRSALAEASIFTGAGGFYFAKLSGATATGLPPVPAGKGEYGLVLKFGLGLRLGVGRSFQRGPLKAELSLTLQGIFEGILAWYHYPVEFHRDPELYYHMQATVQLVGRLYGAVDFEVIKVEVEVIVYAGIQLVIDTYGPIQVVLVAGVSVRATVTILFIEVDFSFDLTIRETFSIGEGTAPPWKGLSTPSNNRTFRMLESQMPFIAPRWRWDPTIKVWGTSDEGETIKQELDILFQPAFTEGLLSDRLEKPGGKESEVKGIALLFIENAINSGEEGKDFNLLSQAMLEWAIHAYKIFKLSTDETISKSDLIDLHKELKDNQNTAFEFNGLMNFLETNFTFKLRENKSSVSGTIFPMFPQLLFLYSDNRPAIDFADKNKKTAGKLKALLGYFDELKVGNTTNGTTSGDAQLASMATIIFIDYFAMLTRSAIQSAIDYLDENPPKLSESASEEETPEEPVSEGTTSISLIDLFNGMTATGKFNQLAGIVSRFMLYGLRLPFNLPFDADTKTYPLYELTGQQFSIPEDADLDNFKLTLKPKDTTPPTWLKINEDQERLPIELHTKQKDFINGLEAFTFSPTLLEKTPLQLFSWTPARFDFRQPQSYSEGSTQKTIWPFPANLVSRLTRLDRIESLEFNVYNGNASEIGSTDRESLSPEWGTLIEFTVRKVPSADGTSFLENIYLVIGIGGRDANSSGEDYLEELIAKSDLGMKISLLYEGTKGEGTKDKILKQAGDEFLLLRTNLAGGTGNSTVFGATQSDVADFFRLLWEAGKNEDGTYLHLDGLPDSVLASSDSLVLRLLSVETETTALGRRHNCMVTESTIVPAEVALYAESTLDDERVKTLNVSPGHVGFHITRQPVGADPETFADELDNLFQLLSYRLKNENNINFNQSRWGMPVGPTVDSVRPENPNDDVWIYERVIPVYRFALDNPLVDSDGLPPAESNPYAGIGQDASIEVEFEFQDVYGNHTTSVAPPDPQPVVEPESAETEADSVPVEEVLPPMIIPVGYTDNIIGLKSWPGALMTYGVASGEAGPHLVLTLDLDLKSYTGDDMADKVVTARAVYERLYYQVHQVDFEFKLTTSLDCDTTLELERDTPLEKTLDKSQFTVFVDQAFRFFDFLADLDQDKLPTLNSIRKGSTSVLPPDMVVMPPVSLSGKLPEDLIFPVTVEIILQRHPNLVHPSFTDVDAVSRDITVIPPLAISDTLSLPPTSIDESSNLLNLRSFAQDFESAFPSLKLMSGNVDDSFGKPATLWAAQFGEGRIDYQVDSGDTASFFAPVPLSNRLFSGEVNLKKYTTGQGLVDSSESQHFDSIDLDIWGREFLSAVDAFLDADLSVPAYKNGETKDQVKNILESKQKLAQAIASQVQPILQQTDETHIGVAKDVFKQQVLTRLENAYTIETIVQLGVDVTLPGDWPGIAPRLSGKPLASGSNGQVDNTLSTAKIPLLAGASGSTLTFIYNTPAPEAERLAKINLSFHVNALEFKISEVDGLPGYEDSSWLTFILPPGETEEGGRNHLGQVEIPVPLRVFPTPPSLILQRAEADMDSLESLEHIREWQFNYIYEHLDAAQDAIETKIYYNEEQSTSAAEAEKIQNKNALFVALANFHTIHPSLLKDMNKDEASESTVIKQAIGAFAQLVSDVAKAWDAIASNMNDETSTGYYEIRRVEKRDDERVIVEYQPNWIGDPTDDLKNELSSMQAKALHGSFYGVPNIPDFIVSIDNRDIIKQQNAWAEIWLSRNQTLGNKPTNPAFVYRTPKVRFGNMLTPLLINDTEWHIEDLLSEPEAPLSDYLEQLFTTLLPAKADKPYDLRISCGYAFALAEGEPGKPDLLVPLPVTLGPRFPVPKDELMQKATDPIRENLVKAIKEWFEDNDPSKNKGILIFKLSILSPAGNLPLLQIDDLRLELKNVNDL